MARHASGDQRGPSSSTSITAAVITGKTRVEDVVNEVRAGMKRMTMKAGVAQPEVRARVRRRR